jgi:hypothetical protein
MEEKLGIKETKEALIGINELAVAIAGALKDGLQVGDAAYLWAKLQSDPAMSAKLMAAYEGASKIPAEVKDLDLGEGIELLSVQASYVPKLVAALSKAV